MRETEGETIAGDYHDVGQPTPELSVGPFV